MQQVSDKPKKKADTNKSGGRFPLNLLLTQLQKGHFGRCRGMLGGEVYTNMPTGVN